MGSKDYWPPRHRSGDNVDSRFERLRHKFYRRLCTDREQLDLLRVELENVKFDAPLPTYERIRVLAHCICGAAELYEDSIMREAADALEWAAIHAIRTGAGNDDPSVGRPVRCMIDILAVMLGGAPPATRLSS
jgi:hypothetical protein